MGKTSISWTDWTENPLIAHNIETGKRGHFCVRIAPECKNCYAAEMNAHPRFLGTGIDFRADLKNKVQLAIDEKSLIRIRNMKEHRKVFVCDMTDLFYEGYPDSWIDRVFDAMESNKGIIKQILTKRAGRMKGYLLNRWAERPRRDFWLGVSAGTQTMVNQCGLALAELEYQWRPNPPILWFSHEPLLEKIDVNRWLGLIQNIHGIFPKFRPIVSWCVIGGESGKNFRPMDLEWARSIKDQYVAAGVPIWYKQSSGRYPGMNPTLDGKEWKQFPEPIPAKQ